MKLMKLAAVGVMAVSLAGCYNAHGGGGAGAGQGAGTILGAIGGGLLGSQIGSGSGRLWATGAGALLGAALGNRVGASLDQRDRNYLGNASYQALDTGYDQHWRNPQSGNYGSVQPGHAYRTSQGYCREYTQTVYIGGQPETAYGKACRQPDGSWEIL